MLNLIRIAILWSLCIIYSILAVYKLLFIYVTKFSTQPWKPKDRPKEPACLSDPKYGIHKFFKVNGLRLHYVEAGDRSKPLMIFVHGFPEFWYSWRHQITEFSKDFWTVAIDMRGYNLSDKPTELSDLKIPDIVDDLRALIEHLNRKQCILVCHDWGSIIGWDFASKYNHMVQKYIMMGAPSREVFRKVFKSSMDQFMRSWYVLFFQMPILPEMLMQANDLAVFSDELAKNNENFTEEDLEAYKHVWSRPGAFTAGINYYRSNFSFDLNPSLEAPGILDGTNGMFVLGEHEKYISLKSLEWTKKEYPNIRIELLPNANHFLQQDAPTATNDLMRDFLGPATDFSVESLT